MKKWTNKPSRPTPPRHTDAAWNRNRQKDRLVSALLQAWKAEEVLPGVWDVAWDKAVRLYGEDVALDAKSTVLNYLKEQAS